MHKYGYTIIRYLSVVHTMSHPNFSATGSTQRAGQSMPHAPAVPAVNPLKNFFRQYKMFIGLPSGPNYYDASVLEYTPNGEVGIMAMTGQDELIMKNPDALLNGEALVQVISSCVPSVRNPRALLTNDITALITAIRHVTYNDKLETELECPSCKHKTLFKIDLAATLASMTYLESEYALHLPNGLSVYVRPYGFDEVLKSLHSQFEQSKIARAVTAPGLTDEERNRVLNEVFVHISRTTYELTCAAVYRVVSEASNVDVTDPKHIAEFIRNVDRDVTERLQKLIEEVNRVGVDDKFTAVCEKCQHTWTSEIDFNPVNFS